MHFDWTNLLLTLAPIALAAANVPPVIIPTVVHAMREAQGISGASGQDKKTHVMNVVRDAVEVFNKAPILASVDHAATLQPVSAGIDTTIALVNRVLDAHPAPAA